MSRSVRILFACTKVGGRSLLAAHLCNRLSPWGEIAASAGFDSGRLPAAYSDLLHTLGYEVPAANPPTLFERYKRGETFGRVITLCCEESGEHCRIFSLSVSELYGRSARIENWAMPDVSLLRERPAEQAESLSRVARELHLRIQGLIGELRGEAEAVPAKEQQGQKTVTGN